MTLAQTNEYSTDPSYGFKSVFPASYADPLKEESVSYQLTSGSFIFDNVVYTYHDKIYNVPQYYEQGRQTYNAAHIIEFYDEQGHMLGKTNVDQAVYTEKDRSLTPQAALNVLTATGVFPKYLHDSKTALDARQPATVSDVVANNNLVGDSLSSAIGAITGGGTPVLAGETNISWYKKIGLFLQQHWAIELAGILFAPLLYKQFYGGTSTNAVKTGIIAFGLAFLIYITIDRSKYDA